MWHHFACSIGITVDKTGDLTPQCSRLRIIRKAHCAFCVWLRRRQLLFVFTCQRRHKIYSRQYWDTRNGCLVVKKWVKDELRINAPFVYTMFLFLAFVTCAIADSWTTYQIEPQYGQMQIRARTEFPQHYLSLKPDIDVEY